MKIVATNTMIPLRDEVLAAFGPDVEFVEIDGTTEEGLLAGTADADALLVLGEHITRPVIERLTRCRSIVRFGIGYDTLDVEAATEHGIWVSNVPDANYREVAVHAIALALAVQRRLPALDAGMRADGWASSFAPGVHRPDDQVFGLWGIGRIGRRVAAMAKAIGYRVIAHDPVLTPEVADELGVELVDRDALLARSNILSLHVPLLDSTRNMLDRDAIAALQLGSIVVNVSRGGLIDEHALAEALQSGHLFGAGIDAFLHEPTEAGNPLLACENAILTPHAAHWSEESLAETKRKVVEEAARILRGEQPRSAVNRIEQDRAA
ncbi:C-terminal binding protein [Agrococcus jejuensis]|uniref:D-3-phosphoglycerate dehydrogenase n=1 Tax=Agrococcus jejuensis TaxID=399736 RepID=A0A1G8DIP3_9MICO|nr:C-terminal binding protein [Agrococcus jejuensis]SDH57240.1 D-3-phosphoglycerate dehydrogenase [Agrococcus jejuensis]